MKSPRRCAPLPSNAPSSLSGQSAEEEEEEERLYARTQVGCWAADRHGGDVTPGHPARGAVGPGRRAHLGPVGAPAAGADPAAVEPPLEPDAGQGEQPAAAPGLHGLAAGRGDVPLAVPGESRRFRAAVVS